MARRSYRPEQIIKKLREAEILLSQGSTVGEAARKIGVTEQTYYRWRREYGGMRIEQVKRLKELEKENTRLNPTSAFLKKKSLFMGFCGFVQSLYSMPCFYGFHNLRGNI